MKVLVIPDIHLKVWVIKAAEELMNTGKYDKAVFLGDFVDDWDCGKKINMYEDIFSAIQDFMKKYPDSLICYGNHDVSYVWEKYESGYSPLARETVVACLKELERSVKRENITFVHKIDNVLFSHAGLTKGFILTHFIYDTDNSIEHIIEFTNAMPREELWDNCSPIWARPDDGYDFFSKGLLQVVGHTPIKKPAYDERNGLLMTDSFSTYPNGAAFGNKHFVWVDTKTKEWGEI